MPYELDVDIIKDCSNFKNEIREVIDGIDKGGEDHPVMMEKVSVSDNSGGSKFHLFRYAEWWTPLLT